MLTPLHDPQLLQQSSVRPASKRLSVTSAASKGLPGRLTLQTYAGSVHAEFDALQCMV